jgi:hypothetical protein
MVRVVAKKALFGVGWVLGGRRPGKSTADMQITQQMSDDNDAALDRVRDLRHEIPDPPVTWRCHAGAWQRWSWLDSEFRDAPAPAALVAHAAAAGVADDVVLVLDQARWRPESDDERTAREHRHDEIDLGEPDDLGQEGRLEEPPAAEAAGTPDA